MSRFEHTNEFRIQKIGDKGYRPTYLAERKVLVYNSWNPFSKKPSGYFWATVVNNRGKGIGSASFELVKDGLEKYIKDQDFYKDCNETVYEFKVIKAQEKWNTDTLPK